jgi:hypothetical protein
VPSFFLSHNQLASPSSLFSPSSRGTNPVRHGPLTLDNPSQPSQQSVHDEHGVQGRECAMTLGSSRIGSDGSSAGCLTNMERDDGGSSSQMEDWQHRESAECALTQSNPPSRKTSGAPEQSHLWDPKRSRGSSRLSARRVSEAEKRPKSKWKADTVCSDAFPGHTITRDALRYICLPINATCHARSTMSFLIDTYRNDP